VIIYTHFYPAIVRDFRGVVKRLSYFRSAITLNPQLVRHTHTLLGPSENAGLIADRNVPPRRWLSLKSRPRRFTSNWRRLVVTRRAPSLGIYVGRLARRHGVIMELSHRGFSTVNISGVRRVEKCHFVVVVVVVGSGAVNPRRVWWSRIRFVVGWCCWRHVFPAAAAAAAAESDISAPRPTAVSSICQCKLHV